METLADQSQSLATKADDWDMECPLADGEPELECEVERYRLDKIGLSCLGDFNALWDSET